MTIAITGANGALGRKIVEALEGRDADFRIVSRTPTESHPRANVVAGGYDDVAGLTKAFQGASSAFLMSTPDMPDLRIRRHRNAIDAAVAAGVSHIIFLSLHDSVPDSPFPFAAANHDAEVYLQAQPAAWTILAPNIYAEAIEAQAGRTVASAGVIDLPFGEGSAGYITRKDIGSTVAGVLTSEGHDGKRYELTGPASHSASEIASMLSDILSRTIRYQPLTEQAYLANLAKFGLSETTARAFFGLSSSIAQQRFNSVNTNVLDIAGHQPTRLYDHLSASRSLFEQ